MTTTVKQSLNPPLKWAGGKRWLVPILRELLGDKTYNRLVEPFVGGMAIALGLLPEKALLNDINPHLINFYKSLQRGLKIDIPLENDKDCYYQYRDRFNQLIKAGQGNTKNAAELFYFLNRSAYNGLVRFNSKGEFNVPFGQYKTINYATDFTNYIPLLKDWVFSSQDFSMLSLEEGDLIYADPPYDVEFTRYSATDFKWEDQIRLAEWLATSKETVIVSNQATERVIDLYTRLGFEITLLEGPRRIACNGDRKPAKEILAFKGL
ncbi:DNA adenine methylase [Aerosakkonemataceae cyanobacterium BLCC-F154]|uniref:Site-specific DNA-methyltransferase (adenine-specific) n=1 Tax=Floridaenema fluviatile BLCC-F154 TaxID=3153640 RepID=A0ABV4Y4K7_9CYAN